MATVWSWPSFRRSASSPGDDQQLGPTSEEELPGGADAPRAVPETIDHTGDEGTVRPGEEKEEVVSIRAPPSLEGEDEEEGEDGEANEGDAGSDDYGSARERGDASSVSSYGSPPAGPHLSNFVKAKPTPDEDDFNAPAEISPEQDAADDHVDVEDDDDDTDGDEDDEDDEEVPGQPLVSSSPGPIPGSVIAASAAVQAPATTSKPAEEPSVLPPASEPLVPPSEEVSANGLQDHPEPEKTEVPLGPTEGIVEEEGEWVEEGDEEEEEEDEDGDETEEEAQRAAFQELVDVMQANAQAQARGGAGGNAVGNGSMVSRLESASSEQDGSAGPWLPPVRGSGGAPQQQTGAGQGQGQSAVPPVGPRLFGGMQSVLEALSRSQQGNNAAASAPRTEEETEASRKLNEVRVKLLRFARRLGQNEQNSVVAQVFYRLDLAERLQGVGRMSGVVRIMGGAVRIEPVRALADELDAQEGSASPLGFDVTVMLIGKQGVGKTATIRHLLGLPFGPAEATPTTRVQETVGVLHGITFRFIEVPGLQASSSCAGQNLKALRAAKRYLGKRQPDAVLYVDRLDWHGRDWGDLELVKPVNEVFGAAIWINTVGLLTHGAASPPEDDAGRLMSYELYTAQRSHAVQQTIRQAAGDARLSNPVVLAENHPMCRTNRAGEPILPSGQPWKPLALLTCLAGKCLAEGHAVLQKHSGAGAGGRPAGPMRMRVPPFQYLISNLLQKKAAVRLQEESHMVDDEDDDAAAGDSDEDEVDYNQLPPFRRLSKKELESLKPADRKEYEKELAEREKLYLKQQWKAQVQQTLEARRRIDELGKGQPGATGTAQGLGGAPEGAAKPGEEEEGVSNIPVPSPELDIPPTFDSDHPTYRYRHVQSDTSQWVLRPVSEVNGWDHDVGFNSFQVEASAPLFSSMHVPAYITAQVDKDKKDCAVQVESAMSLRFRGPYPGSYPVCTLGVDGNFAGRDQRMATLRADIRVLLPLRNSAGLGVTLTKYPDISPIPGIKVEDSLHLGKQVALHAAAGIIQSGRTAARGLNFEAKFKGKDFPVDRNVQSVALSLVDAQGDLLVGLTGQSQLSLGRGSNAVLRGSINSRAAGNVSLRLSSTEHMQLALVGLIPLLRHVLGGGLNLLGAAQADEDELGWGAR